MQLTKITDYLRRTLSMCLISTALATAQPSMDSIFLLPDTARTLSLDEFYKIILVNHPVVKQANLLNEIAQQEIRLARGAFDPKLVSNVDHKELQDKTYYSKLDAYLSFPTWFPVNPKVGYERNTGELVNAEERIAGGQQMYAGVSIPIGKGLFTDERRAALKQANLFVDIAEADQLKIINKTLLEAAKDYWQWYYAFYQYRLSSQAVSIAEEIFSRIKINMEYGEAAMIDTVQAKITLQTRRVERQEALLAFQNAGVTISNYLWDQQGNPIQLHGAVAPVLTAADQVYLRRGILENLLLRAKENHPELVKLSVKLDQLAVEQRLAREWMKPQIDFNYSVLSQPQYPQQIDPLNDYKLSVDFSFPLFLRKERSKLALTKLKIENTEYERKQSEREILNQITVTFNQLSNNVVIIGQQEEVVALYVRLFSSELLNVENGESDLFKINIQLEKLLQAQLKLIKLTSELQKQKALLYWSAGVANPIAISN